MEDGHASSFQARGADAPRAAARSAVSRGRRTVPAARSARERSDRAARPRRREPSQANGFGVGRRAVCQDRTQCRTFDASRQKYCQVRTTSGSDIPSSRNFTVSMGIFCCKDKTLTSKEGRLFMTASARHRGGRGQEGRVPVGPGACGRADGVARDVAELRPIAADVRGWEAAGKAERGAILDRICAKCDGLASRIRADVAGIWLKVEELRSRISRPLEYLMPKPKTESYGLDEVMRDATRAAEAWNRNHAAPTNSRPRGQSR